MAQPVRKTARLRFGRLSAPGAYYFVTFCTERRVRVLLEQQLAMGLSDVLRSMNESRDMTLVAATIMPDHIHLLFALGERLQVGQVIGKIKTLSRKRMNVDWRWQDESFERQLRLGDSLEDYGFYIYMNPYRAGLCRLSERWSGWICPQPENFLFLARLEDDQTVPEEWLGRSKEIADRIVVRA